jgi:hypothetical protein
MHVHHVLIPSQQLKVEEKSIFTNYTLNFILWILKTKYVV